MVVRCLFLLRRCIVTKATFSETICPAGNFLPRALVETRPLFEEGQWSDYVFFGCCRFHSRVVFEGIWSLTLLTYSHLVYTSVSIVNCRHLGNDRLVRRPAICIAIIIHVAPLLQRWFVNGSIGCYEGNHLGLAFLAIISLIVAAALIPFTALIVYYDKIRRVSEKAPVSSYIIIYVR